MAGNKNLNAAAKAKKDEFYDPYESDFEVAEVRADVAAPNFGIIDGKQKYGRILIRRRQA